MVHYLYRMCQCGLPTVLSSLIVIIMRLLTQNLAVPHDFYSFLSISVEPLTVTVTYIIDGDALEGYKSMADAFSLA